MSTTEIRIDHRRSLAQEPDLGHNRWHPDIPPAIRVAPGTEVTLQTRDALDGQIGPGSSVEDVSGLDINRVHPLTGPVYVEGAETGDVLVVDILDVDPASFGFTCQSVGFGFLRDEFSEPFLARWQIADGWATSNDVPGVRIPGAPFPGTIGVAPSRELMNRATERERALAEHGGMVDLPSPAAAVPAGGDVAAEGLRTIPPRENAGNVDVKQLTAGSRLLIPVWTEGALFSAGDAHFAQGDCEACGQAIEMTSVLTVRLSLLPGGETRAVRDLRFEGSLAGLSAGSRYFATTGICVRGDGTNAFEDVTVAARNAVRNMIEHLCETYGYTRQQAYTICSVAVDLKVSQVVDVPNVLVSAFLPLDIFG